MRQFDDVPFNTLVGLTLTSVVNEGAEVRFETEDGRVFRMYHYQECCEDVAVEDINGDLPDLIGSPVLFAEESTNDSEPGKSPSYGDDSLWTFYRIGTVKGTVVIRWLGTSNGYYSVSVSFEEGKA